MTENKELAPEWQEQKEKREKLVVPEGMSKRAYKKLLKQEKLAAERDEFVAKRKEKRKQLRENKKRERDSTPQPSPPAKRIKQEPTRSGVKIVLDCGFDDLMTEGERTSLARQLVRCYSENRRAPLSVDLHISGFNGLLRDRFENRMHSHHLQWENITFDETDSVDTAQPIVYLSSDSSDTLTELTPGTTYVVGGIVDKGRYKDLCKNKAEKLGIRTARLPIDQNIRLSGRRVLATNHVFELLLKWLELKDWKLAFEAVLPSRKVIPPKQPKPQATD